MTEQQAAKGPSPGKGRPNAAADPWAEVRQEFGLYTASGLADLLAFGGPDNARARHLTGKAQVLAVADQGTFVYPGFQFDSARTRMVPAAKDIIRLGRRNGWRDEELLQWFCRPNPLLAGKRPVDVLADEERVLTAAGQDLER